MTRFSHHVEYDPETCRYYVFDPLRGSPGPYEDNWQARAIATCENADDAFRVAAALDKVGNTA
jgi:hypothetical protein